MSTNDRLLSVEQLQNWLDSFYGRKPMDEMSKENRTSAGSIVGQLIDTMRETERLREALLECKDNIIKWGKSECDFFRYVNETLSNKESNDNND